MRVQGKIYRKYMAESIVNDLVFDGVWVCADPCPNDTVAVYVKEEAYVRELSELNGELECLPAQEL